MEYRFEINDIVFESDQPITGELQQVEGIQSHDVFAEEIAYADYEKTPLQFKMVTNADQQVRITIPYSKRMSDTDAAHSVICFHDQISNWRLVETTCDQDKRIIQATLSGRNLIIGLFINEYFYSEYTQYMADEFPTWTTLRGKKFSLGQRFLNYFGMQFERGLGDLKDIRRQRFIDTLDPNMMDWVYVYPIPKISSIDSLTIYDQEDADLRKPVPILSSLKEFFYNMEQKGVIIDYESRVMYSIRRYETILGVVENIDNRQGFRSTPAPHLIWNAFDEFGLLVGVKRLTLERNAEYRERIKDAFRYPANNSELGLTHALGRELGLIRRFVWKNDTKNLYIKGSGLDHRTIRVDGQKIESNMYAVDRFGNIMVQAFREGKEHTVSIIKDVFKHQLYDKQDEELYKMMFGEDGQATDKLINWVNYINEVAPVMWGKFNWDEGYWDTISRDLTGIGYLPNIWDSDIKVWDDYTFRLDLAKEKF
ncbi:low copy number virion structural protein (plasmid) [Paenibacillus urinalis]|uniref:Low copy number virion structural protein n=1 Tax=Paenibacillus urinalis TaxID=521520 RepID=A0ABY7XN76_9BACL|nr:low copy number virion structural protein [Paenibacillus urinalis]WDI05100.1 low copy number virion structural protein [Paenibacillus urinalis]